MAYRVRLINIEHENCPYELGGICADNAKEAIDKAKKIIAEQGYWYPGEDDLKKRYKKLKAESVMYDNI